MTWYPRERFRNETMMLGPHRLLAHLQMEMDQLGRDRDQPWIIHGWELTPLGWVACMVRTIHLDPMEDA